MVDTTFLNQKPGIIQGFLIRNNPVVFTIGADNSRWPSTLSLEIGSATTDVVPLVFSVSRFEDGDQVAVWELDAAVVEDIYAKFGGYPSVRITWGVDAAKTIQFAGRLFWVDEWRGSKNSDIQSFGHYVIGPTGPAGPSAVSEDANNIATIGSDSKIYVPSLVPYVHDHDDRYFTDTEVTTLLSGKANNLGLDDNYVTAAEKTKLTNLSGTNTGDQVLPIWSTLSGKPATFPPSTHNHDDRYFTEAEVTTLLAGKAASLGADDNYVTAAEKAALHTHPAIIAQGATQAAARTAISAGTSSLAIGTTGTTAAAGNRQATETAIGMVELATTFEATTGTDTARAVTPAGVKAVADTMVPLTESVRATWADTDLSASRPGTAICYWQFSAGTDVGASGSAIVNALEGDLYYVFGDNIGGVVGVALTIPDSPATGLTVSLTVAGWSANSQTVAAGVTATSLLVVAPTPADQTAYVAAGIICTTQGAGTLTFICTTTPTAALDVQVVIL